MSDTPKRDTHRLRLAIQLALASFPIGILPTMALAQEPTEAPEPPGLIGSPHHFSCPSGEATVPKAIAQEAAKKAAKDSGGAAPSEVLGCPQFYGSMRTGDEPMSELWGGWTVDEEQTKAKQEAGEDVCVYDWVQPCPGGRLLAEGSEHIVAATRPGTAWTDPETHAHTYTLGQSVASEPSLRSALANGWLDDAKIEHASIASFARAVLELMQHGAPPCLISAAQAAGIDEVRHAQRCFALAAAYADVSLEPAALDAPSPRTLDLPSLAAATFLEGCVGETIGTLSAERARQQCNIPAVRDALSEIIADETRHTALAWATIQWALDIGGEEVSQAIFAAARAALQDLQLRRAPAPQESIPPNLLGALRAHGRLDAASQHQASLDAWQDIIQPTLAAFGIPLNPLAAATRSS